MEEEENSEDNKDGVSKSGDKRKIVDDEDDIEAKYGLADYDEEDENGKLHGEKRLILYSCLLMNSLSNSL
jgi:hypothetical protein